MQSIETYFQRVIGLQRQLYAYILTLLADTEAADDVLQETNLVLCRKMAEFAEGASFEAWAFRIARIQCLAYWKFRSRDRLILDEVVLSAVSSRAEARVGELDARMRALRKCLADMPSAQRELLEGRYEAGGSVKKLAAQLGRAEPWLSRKLYRLRVSLLDCIRARLTPQEVGTA